MDTVRPEFELSCRVINLQRAVGHDFGRYSVLLQIDRPTDRPVFKDHPVAGT